MRVQITKVLKFEKKKSCFLLALYEKYVKIPMTKSSHRQRSVFATCDAHKCDEWQIHRNIVISGATFLRQLVTESESLMILLAPSATNPIKFSRGMWCL